jgi:hypothetical protein
MAIIDWLVPKNSHEVGSFMGIDSYYRRSVEGFSNILKPSPHCSARESRISGITNVAVYSSRLRYY